jgi:hypothetical protein
MDVDQEGRVQKEVVIGADQHPDGMVQARAEDRVIGEEVEANENENLSKV